MHVTDQIGIHLCLGFTEPGQMFTRGARLADPLLAVLRECRGVHQHRLHLRKRSPQPVEDDEAVGVDVAPIGDPGLVQPSKPGEPQHVEPRTEHRQHAGQRWQSKEGDLVFHHEEAGAGRWHLGEFIEPDSEVGERHPRPKTYPVEAAQPNPVGLARKPVSTSESAPAARRSFAADRFQELTEQALVGLDEFGVHAGHVDLPQIDTTAHVISQPQHGPDHRVPFVGMPHRAHRMLARPLPEPRIGGTGDLEKRLVCRDGGPDPQTRPDLVGSVEPHRRRYFVGPDQPPADSPRLQPPAGLAQRAYPRLDAAEILTDLPGGRAAHRHADRHPRHTAGHMGHQLSAVPAPAQRGHHIGRAGPRCVAHWAVARSEVGSVRWSRYSLIDMVCSRDLAPLGLST